MLNDYCHEHIIPSLPIMPTPSTHSKKIGFLGSYFIFPTNPPPLPNIWWIWYFAIYLWFFIYYYFLFILLRTDSWRILQSNILLCFKLVGTIWKTWQKLPNLLMHTTMMKLISSLYNILCHISNFLFSFWSLN